jgi:hypothetical protein
LLMWRLCSNFKSSGIWENEVKNDICSSWHFYVVFTALQEFTDRICDLQHWFSTNVHMAKRLSSAPSSMPEKFQQSSLKRLVHFLSFIVFRLIINSNYKVSFSLSSFLPKVKLIFPVWIQKYLRVKASYSFSNQVF